MDDGIKAIAVTGLFGFVMWALIALGNYTFPAQADQPRMNCECRELTRIRLLLEHQFGAVCDERHCEGSSSSGQGGSLP